MTPGGGSTSPDPREGLRAVAALRCLVERLEDLQVERARGLGWSWSEIATVLGISKQAVHKKHAGHVPVPPPRSQHRSTMRVHSQGSTQEDGQDDSPEEGS